RKPGTSNGFPEFLKEPSSPSEPKTANHVGYFEFRRTTQILRRRESPLEGFENRNYLIGSRSLKKDFSNESVKLVPLRSPRISLKVRESPSGQGATRREEFSAKR